MSEERIVELEKLISDVIIKLLPPLKVQRVILDDTFNLLFEYLEELKFLMFERKTIPRSLVSKLFHLYYSVIREFSFIPDSDKTNTIKSSLTFHLASIFDDNFNL